MPFDTETISIVEAENFMNNAPWIERYLIGIAYNAFSSPNVSPSYDLLDKHTASYEMPQVSQRLNAELTKLGLGQIGAARTMSELIRNLRALLINQRRANMLDWLVGNEDPTFWEEAKKREAWTLDDDQLLVFCNKLSEAKKQARLKAEG